MCLENKIVFEKLYILSVAIIILLFCSQSGPLYIANQWVDANIYFTIGRSMQEGLLPYVDLYDHKGPVIYFIHFFAAMIFSKSFFGVWLIEIFCGFIFLYYSYKTLELFIDKNNLVSIPAIALIIYTSKTFCEGDSAEELCLPALMYVFYYGFKVIKQKYTMNYKDGFIVGLCFGYVFWMKYTIIGFFLGFALFFLYYSLKNNYFKSYAHLFVGTVMGIFVFSGIILLYFIYRNGFNELIQVYFYDNLFVYNRASSFSLGSIADNLFNGLFSIVYYYHIGLIFIVLGWHYMFKYENRYIFMYSICCFIFLFLSSFSGGRTYLYYNFIFSIFIPLGVIMIASKLKPYSNFNVCFAVEMVVLLSCCAFLFTPNRAYILQKKESFFLEPYAKIISKAKNPTLINYGVMDLGLYNYCNIIPRHRFFSLNNMDQENMASELSSYIEREKVDFIFAPSGSTFSGYSSVCERKFYQYMLCLYKRDETKLKQ